MNAGPSIDAAGVRVDVLEMAAEDCYGFPEFHRMWDKAFGGNHTSATEAAREQIARLIDEGLVRVHRGEMCRRDQRTSAELELSADELRQTVMASWEPDAPARLYLCSTEQTEDAFQRDCRAGHPGKRR